ncbi:sensor histidine kinase [Geosporobacter ferrireducens]|uniref:histidine kinase n=1 Tax=Geosporobacter ferrireducens TaxID=1424294 RepID=A0A1D8GP24_9FIRM|nr:sensor histidine kinase [Geosporobacter ferrireducens]AOT72699.1 histidine kinase [Geosporobacter ferrireducens]MTI55108.1 sensor histidine kinase [Geosporobacter ferrireducens]
MYKPSLDVKKLNDIVKKTIDSLEKGKNEIFDIAESARNECRSAEQDLESIKKAASLLIEEVDMLIALEKKSRQKLVLVSKDFKKFTEQDIKSAYEEAKDLQIKMTLKRQEERELIKQRTELERRLKHAYEVVKKAERLVSQVGVAMGYLSGNLRDVFEQLEDIQQKQELGIKIIKAQEEERQRVARDIHDGPAQSMANVVIKAEICEKLINRDTEQTKYELNQLKNFVRDALKDLRKIIYDLRPMSLDDLGLVPTIQRFIINFEDETKINVNFSVMAKGLTIDSIIQLSVFRIIQEALHNVNKHAKASMVVIKLEVMHKNINMLIIDDGIGFNVEKAFTSTKEECSYGLFIMRERVELLKGNIEITSDVGKGTRIRVSIPLGEEEELYDKK